MSLFQEWSPLRFLITKKMESFLFKTALYSTLQIVLVWLKFPRRAIRNLSNKIASISLCSSNPCGGRCFGGGRVSFHYHHHLPPRPSRHSVGCRMSKQLTSSAHCLLEKNKWRGGTRWLKTTFRIGNTERILLRMRPKLYGSNTKFQAILHPCPRHFIMINHISLSM